VSRKRGEPRWVSRIAVRAIHADQIRQHGSAPGLCDPDLLKWDLDRPENRWRYEPDSGLARMAAA